MRSSRHCAVSRRCFGVARRLLAVGFAFGIDAGVADSSAVVAEGIEEARAGLAQREFGEGAERLFNL